MYTTYLGPFSASETETIKRALQAHLDSIDDCIENGPSLSIEEAVPILEEQARTGRILDRIEFIKLNQ
ncbi:MAG: hypothetical protein J6P46_00195 [Bacteroidales bacterium]|nr:hypothetical protein [Bacteroidales bacterium]